MSEQLSDVATAMNVFFKSKKNDPITPRDQAVRERLESMDSSSSDKGVHKLFIKQDRAERNRTQILETRVRALSEQDEIRLEKVDAIKTLRDRKGERINDSQERASLNRSLILKKKTSRLKRRHTLIENSLWVFRKEEIEARTKLGVILEKKDHLSELKRRNHLRKLALKARENNKKVAETLGKVKEEERIKKEMLREQWEEKIERAREKRQQLLYQKTNAS